MMMMMSMLTTDRKFSSKFNSHNTDKFVFWTKILTQATCTVWSNMRIIIDFFYANWIANVDTVYLWYTININFWKIDRFLLLLLYSSCELIFFFFWIFTSVLKGLLWNVFHNIIWNWSDLRVKSMVILLKTLWMIDPSMYTKSVLPIYAHRSENIQTMTQPVHGFTRFEICRWNGCAECRNRTNHQIFAHSVFVSIMHPFQWISVEIRLGNAFNMYAWVYACVFYEISFHRIYWVSKLQNCTHHKHTTSNTFDIRSLGSSILFVIVINIVLHFNVVFQSCNDVCLFAYLTIPSRWHAN